MLKLKLVLLFFLCFIFLEKSHAQPGITEQLKPVIKKKKRSLNLFFAPEISYRTLQATSENQWIIDAKNELEIPAIGYTLGGNYIRHITPQVDFELGFWFSSRNIRTKKIDYLWNKGQLQPAGKIKYFYNYHYIQIPIKLSFYFSEKRNYFMTMGVILFDSFTDGGSHKAKIWNANGDFEKKIKIETPFYFGENTAGVLLSVGKRWQFHPNLALRIEPMFKLSIQSATDKEYFGTFFYSFGVNVGVDLW